jgi:hypothetical protein
MPTYTGQEIARQALRECEVIDPTEAGEAELIADTLVVATNLLDLWRRKKLTISGVTRNVYSLVSGTQAYTIGSGGTFNQTWPTAIERWSVIPDDDAADPVEQSRGRPLTAFEWQQVRVKSLQASSPSVMYWDGRSVAGLGTASFYPVPDNNDVDVVLYCFLPEIVSLVQNTSYTLPPGMSEALITCLARRLCNRHGIQASEDLKDMAKDAFGIVQAANVIPREAPIRREWSLGAGRSGFNVYTGS